MRKYRAGQFVPPGTYLNRKTWEWIAVHEHGDYLTGSEGVTYYRVPLLLVLALGPLIGLAFILFLPFAVPLLALYTAFKVIAGNIPWRRPKGVKQQFRSVR